MAVLFGGAFFARPLFGQTPGPEEPATASGGEHAFRFFALFTDPKYTQLELVALFVVLGIAIAGLVYALMLARQVKAADQGTKRMQDIAAAVREGADAYLAAQFRKIGPLILIITVVLYFTTQSDLGAFKFGRAGAFAVGAVFSWLVGFVGMRLATTGNLRVAAAARHSYGEAMQLGYRTGTVTGMLTDGLGLLGGTLIFMPTASKPTRPCWASASAAPSSPSSCAWAAASTPRPPTSAPTWLARSRRTFLKMIRATPRPSRTTWRQCGRLRRYGADIFESYEVTIVAAMILGLATFGHKGVIFRCSSAASACSAPSSRPIQSKRARTTPPTPR